MAQLYGFTCAESGEAESTQMKRDKYNPKTIILVGEVQKNTAILLIQQAPIDPVHPVEVVIRDQVKARKLDQNGYYWLRIGEIAAQAWIDGRQFSADTWHEYMKREVMPEEITTKNGVTRSKWEFMPNGERTVLSTTLLERGCFAEYTTAVEAFGASMGVQFSASPMQ
jgi:hypothetical protein